MAANLENSEQPGKKRLKDRLQTEKMNLNFYYC